MPFPVRSEVIVTLFGPVNIVPLVMFSVETPMSLPRVTTLLEDSLLRLSVPKVVAPNIAESAPPANCTEPVPGRKAPLFNQLPLRECVNEPPLNDVPAPIFRSPAISNTPPAVLLPPVEKLRLSYVVD